MVSNNKNGNRLYIRRFRIIGLLVALLALAGLGAMKAGAQEHVIPLGSPVATIVNTDVLGQPAADGPLITRLPVNAHATVMGGPFNEESWYWISYNSTVRGYVRGSALVIVDEKWTPVVPPTSTPRATNTPVPPTPTATPTPDTSIPAQPGVYTGLWIGQMTTGGNVRTGPGTNNKVLKSWWAGRRVILYEQVKDVKGDIWYRVSDPPEDPMFVHSSLVSKVMEITYQSARFKGRWIDVNLTQQVVTAYVDGTPVKVTLTSTGKKSTPTEVGTWKIYWRLPKQTMQGGNLAAGDYYRLEDVPYPQYFHTSGEALHGTYWHDNFGYPMSHGCVNLSTPMSKWLYEWANVGTVVYVHY